MRPSPIAGDSTPAIGAPWTWIMYLNVTASGVELLDIDHLRDLYVLTAGIDDTVAATSLRASGFGDLVGDHCWLDTETIRTAGDDSPSWAIGFSAMVTFAANHGWTSEDGSRIRAHLVRS